MNIAFKIEPSVDKNIELHLLTEVGDEDISFLIFSKTPFKIEGFCSLNFEKNIEPKNYHTEVKKYMVEATFLQDANFSSIKICYNFSTSTLVPLQYFIENEKQQIIDKLFVPDITRICFQELCLGKNIKNVYSVPSAFHNWLIEKYPSGKFAHSTSCQIVNNSASTLNCIIYSSSIKLVFFREGQLQIVQYFNYTKPLDICYHLLNVAERFDIAPVDFKLTLSGMVDVSSSLYQELYKYFLKIDFAETTDVIVSEVLEELPTHFYHHLTALAHAHN